MHNLLIQGKNRFALFRNRFAKFCENTTGGHPSHDIGYYTNFLETI